MDHELKQRLIGAAVVTALCAIFIPMLFDDPVDSSGQLVSELNIPAPVQSPPSQLPVDAQQPDIEPLTTEVTGDVLESTGAEEEVAEPEKSHSKQEPLYAESEGYTQENDGGVADPSLKKAEDRELSNTQPHPKPLDAIQSRPLSTETAKIIVPKAAHVDSLAKETAKLKKLPETIKPTAVKKLAVPLENELLMPPKQPGTAKSLAAAVAEAKAPVATPKPSQKLVRWYIQVGSFSKKENAMSLWESLHEQGLPAALDTIQTDKGVSYRLRVGPELDGKKAAAMKARLDKQNIQAILISE